MLKKIIFFLNKLNPNLKITIHHFLKPFFEIFLRIYFKKFNLYLILLSDKGRITLYVGYLEPIIRKLKFESKSKKLVAINQGEIANTQMKKMFAREITILKNIFL